MKFYKMREEEILDAGRPHGISPTMGECDCEECNEYDELERIEKREALKRDLTLGEIVERDISRIEQEEITEAMKGAMERDRT